MDSDSRVLVAGSNGMVGSAIVRNLESKGYIVYEPVTDGPHHFDKLISKDKKILAIVEIKTYERLKFKPETGINLKNYKEYLDIKNIEVFVFFVDYITESIYGNKLSILSKQIEINKTFYPYVMKSVTGDKQMFHLKSMIEISKLKKDDCIHLKNKTNINKKYI